MIALRRVGKLKIPFPQHEAIIGIWCEFLFLMKKNESNGWYGKYKYISKLPFYPRSTWELWTFFHNVFGDGNSKTWSNDPRADQRASRCAIAASPFPHPRNL